MLRRYEMNLWPIILGMAVVPGLGILYVIWEYFRDTKLYRLDIRNQRKYYIKEIVEKVGTATHSISVINNFTRGHSTFIKSFDYFIKAGEYTYLTKDSFLYSSLKKEDTVTLEISEHAKVPLLLTKVP